MSNETDQFFILHTGHNDISRMGEVQRWCEHPYNVSCLDDPNNGYIQMWDPWMELSPGHLFYVGVYALEDADDPNDVKPLWIDILYRNIYLEYNKTYNFKGVDLYQYGIQFDPMLLNTTLYPPNSQFDQIGPSGVLNSTAAYDDISIFLAMVLFYGAPDFLVNNSKMGLPQPGPDDYPFIDIEPKTGAVFYANASMQICTKMHPLPNLLNETIPKGEPNLFNLPNDMMIPMYLVTFSDKLTNSLTNTFKSNVDLGDTLKKVSIYAGWISLGLVIIYK